MTATDQNTCAEISARALLQEHQILCQEIQSIQQNQRKMVFSSILSSGAIIPFATIYAATLGDTTSTFFDQVVIYVGMILSLLLMMMLCFYIGQYVFIFRITKYIREALSPSLNALIEGSPLAGKLLIWEEYLATEVRPSRLAWASYLLIAVAEASSLFLLCCAYNLMWILAHLRFIDETFGAIELIFVAAQLVALALIAVAAIMAITASRGTKSNMDRST